jgi:hypothetical protein
VLASLHFRTERHAETVIVRVAWMISALLIPACAGPGQQMDARSAYNGTQNIADTAAAGKAAAAQCKQGGPAAATFCPKVDEAFDNIAAVAKAINQNAEKAGGAK